MIKAWLAEFAKLTVTDLTPLFKGLFMLPVLLSVSAFYQSLPNTQLFL
jgi:hypothetical protein